MIKAIHLPQMVSAKPRSGLNSIGDLIPRLIQHYETLAEFRSGKLVGMNRKTDSASAVAGKRESAAKQQSFSWYEN